MLLLRFDSRWEEKNSEISSTALTALPMRHESFNLAPNSGPQPLPEVGVRHERTLFAVARMPLIRRSHVDAWTVYRLPSLYRASL